MRFLRLKPKDREFSILLNPKFIVSVIPGTNPDLETIWINYSSETGFEEGEEFCGSFRDIANVLTAYEL